jgi:hypothetical protein
LSFTPLAVALRIRQFATCYRNTGMDEQSKSFEPAEKPRRRWFQFRLRTMLILVAILAVPLTYIAHSIYAPSARKGSYIVFRVMEAPPSIWPANDKPDREGFELYKRNLAEFARAPIVIDKVLNDRNVNSLPLMKQLGPNAADWLADQIVVNNPADSEVMEIGVLENDQTQGAVIAKALADAFQREIVDKERTDKLEQRDRLDKKFRNYKSNILEKQRQLFELEQQIGPKDDHKAELANRLHRLDQAAADADRAEMQAELQIARGKHKLEGLAESSSEFKAIKSEIDLAEVDRRFWNDKSEALTAQIDDNAMQMGPQQKFTGDVDQLRIEIDQLQKVVNEMGLSLTKWNIDLDAEPRVMEMGTRSD